MKAAARPEILERWADEFNPRTTRSAYPTTHTLYWDFATDDGVTQVE